MSTPSGFSRRGFLGAAAAAIGYVTIKPADAYASVAESLRYVQPLQGNGDEYDSLAKISFNENPWGPPESVLKAMHHAFKYANRYGYPDGGVVPALAAHHGVPANTIMLGTGSGEILDVCCT